MHKLEIQINTALKSLELAQNTDYIGEQVSQLEHSLQCAYFAEQSGHSKDVILASLFHDIGHFASNTLQFNMAHLGVAHHEWIGAKLAIDFGFSAKVALLIGYHVDAKRYLASKKASYFDRLSEASKSTLNFQGGIMTEEEMKTFESHPYFKEIIQVRINDEKAKEINLKVPDINYYYDDLREHFSGNNKQNDEMTLSNYIDNLWVKKFKDHLNDIIE